MRPGRQLQGGALGRGQPGPHRGGDRHAARRTRRWRRSAPGWARAASSSTTTRADMVAVARMVSRFLYVESCGQCPACKFGTGEVTAYLENMTPGIGDRTRHRADRRAARRRSPTRTAATSGRRSSVVISSLAAGVPRGLRRPSRGGRRLRSSPVPKIVDMVDGVAVYDEHQARSGRTGPTPTSDQSAGNGSSATGPADRFAPSSGGEASGRPTSLRQAAS